MIRKFVNKKAIFNYSFTYTIETGIALKGDEVKAIRAGKVSLQGSYGKILYNKKSNPELWLVGAHINSNIEDPIKTRKLLVHKHEIAKLVSATNQKGLTIVPVKIFFQRGRVKLEMALAKGRKTHDKRELIKQRDLQRELKTNKI